MIEHSKVPYDESCGLVVMIGNTVKRQAFASFQIQQYKPSSRGNGEIHMFVSSVKGDKRPFFLADTHIPPKKALPYLLTTSGCHEIMNHQFQGGRPSDEGASLNDELFHKLLFPFADVVCAFVSDIGGIEASIKRISAWTDRGSPSICPVHPRLLLVVEKQVESYSRERLRYFLDEVEPEKLKQVFQSISITTFSRPLHGKKKRRGSRAQQWRSLQQSILDSLEITKQARRRSRFLLSSRHTIELLEHAASIMTQPSQKPFDFIMMSRRHRKVADDLTMHLTEFLEKFTSPTSAQRVGVPLIASSLILDHYTPGMHCKSFEEIQTSS